MFSLMMSIAGLLLLAPSQPVREADMVGPQLAEIRSFAARQGERLWPGYGSAPFGFLLLGENSETLLCQDAPPTDFAPDGTDPSTRCDRFTRPRTGLPRGLLAAMPLFGPPSTIVMGTPASTGRTPADWARTILHEHFHQWQSALPDYYARTDALDLKGGDETGMWMLNFPFPYEDSRLSEAYAEVSLALAAALDARGKPGFLEKFDRYLSARNGFERRAGAANWRYLELQLWQEGVARWTEIELGRAYPDPEVQTEAARLEAATLAQLRTPDLKKQKRELAYPLGAGEAWLMDSCGSRWRQDYPKRLALGPLLKAARAACAAR